MQLRFGELALGAGFVQRAGRDEVLRGQLLLPLLLGLGELDARLGRLYGTGHGGACAGDVERSLLGAGFELDNELALAHEVAALHLHLSIKPSTGLRMSTLLARFDQAIELFGAYQRGRKERQQADQGTAHGE